MAGFWEECLARTYCSFAADNRVGQADVEWWIQNAIARGFLQWKSLNGDSLLLAILTSSPESPLRDWAAREIQSRNLASPALGETLTRGDWRDLADRFVDVARTEDDSDRDNNAFDAFWRWFGAPLIRFFTRLYLADFDIAFRSAFKYVKRVHKEDEYESIEDFGCRLYQHVLPGIPIWVPPRLRKPPPRWWGSVSTEEHRFLAMSLALEFLERVILFGSVYGELTTWEMACVCRKFGAVWNTGRVAGVLRAAWEKLLADP